VQFKVVPDATVRALELRKGSADVALNAVTADMVRVLRNEKSLEVLAEPGTIYQYLALNFEDPNLRKREVRQALDCGTDREPLIHYLWRDMARPAASVLPPNHWAYDPALKPTPYDPRKAIELLEQAGYRAGPDGVRLRLTLKTSTEETSRQLGAVVQQQWRKIGVALDIRSYEFATYYADIVKGAFQIYTLRWIGANNDPDIFEYCFHSRKFPPNGANRGQ
jgi:peptide/nickel transport system substrate-binding protein